MGGGFAVYPNDNGLANVIGANDWGDLILTRTDAGRLRGYVDGVQQFDLTAMNPNEARLTAENVLRFFRDKANREESAGAVSRIRLYADQMPPAHVAAVTG